MAQSFSTIWLAPIPAAHQGASFSEKAFDRLHVEIEHVPVGGHRVLHAHDELHIRRARDLALPAISAALRIWLRSKASISGFTSCFSISDASQSTRSGGFS
jgi:hypothetical protein